MILVNPKQRIVFPVIVANFALFISKLILGLLGRSQALIADSIDTLSDMVGDILIFAGFKFSEKPPDEEHPYGHGKIESLVVGIIGTLIIATVGFIVIRAFNSIFYKTKQTPSFIALFGSILSIAVKFLMYIYLIKNATRYSSPALYAGAAHAKSDMLSSIVSFLGISFSILGINAFDPIAAVIISIMIAKTGIGLFKISFSELTDKAINPKMKQDIIEAIRGFPEVKGAHLLRSRIAGGRIELDVHLQFDPLISIDEAHLIAHKVKKAVMQRYPNISEFLVHLEPQKHEHISTKELEKQIGEKLNELKEVKSFHGLIFAKTRDGNLVCLDIEVDKKLGLKKAHSIAKKVEEIVKAIANCKNVVVHIDLEGNHEID